jgi:hypothetical protein
MGSSETIVLLSRVRARSLRHALSLLCLPVPEIATQSIIIPSRFCIASPSITLPLHAGLLEPCWLVNLVHLAALWLLSTPFTVSQLVAHLPKHPSQLQN